MAMDTVGRYEIKRQLGRGGMASVYLAHDPHFKRNVAVKLLPRDLLHDENFKSRFTREAQTVAALEHPNIVPVYDFGESNGQPYLVMQYMAGGSLSERIEQRPIGIEEASQIIKRIGSALDYAHSQGIVHRDLKPGNILFDNFGNCYLADFGIVRLAEASTTLTDANAIIGTPAYMSPEQVHGDKELDGRSDIYSLAIILFEMLTGKQPFEADTPAKVMMRHILDPIPSVRDVNPELPAGSGLIFSNALAKEPEARYLKAGQLATEFENLIDTPLHIEEDLDETLVEPSETVVEKYVETFRQTQSESPPLAPQLLPQSKSTSDSQQARNLIRIGGIVGLAVILLVGGGLLLTSFLNSQPGDRSLPLDSPTATTTSIPTKQVGVTSETTPTPLPSTPLPTTNIEINSSLGKEILARGEIRIGIQYRSGFWPFSVIDPENSTHSGFELELVKELISRMFPSSVSIEWVYTRAEDRLEMLKVGEIDLLARNTTHTVSREEYGLWSRNYFLDGMRLLTFRGDGYTELEEMDGGQVSVLIGTTNELIIAQAIEASGLEINIFAADWDPAMESFVDGDSNAFAGWWISLLSAKGQERSYQVIGRLLTGNLDGAEIGKEPIAFGIPPGQNEFRDEVDAILLQIIQDGTWQDLYDQWFPDPPPWTIDEMLAEPPLDR